MGLVAYDGYRTAVAGDSLLDPSPFPPPPLPSSSPIDGARLACPGPRVVRLPGGLRPLGPDREADGSATEGARSSAALIAVRTAEPARAKRARGPARASLPNADARQRDAGGDAAASAASRAASVPLRDGRASSTTSRAMRNARAWKRNARVPERTRSSAAMIACPDGRAGASVSEHAGRRGRPRRGRMRDSATREAMRPRAQRAVPPACPSGTDVRQARRPGRCAKREPGNGTGMSGAEAIERSDDRRSGRARHRRALVERD